MYEMISMDDSLRIIKELRAKYYYKRGIEEVNVDEALDRELAEDIISPKTLPRYNLATMDGYAIRAEDKYPLKIVGKIFADVAKIPKIKPGEAYYVTTGSPLPEGANAVLKIELAKVEGELLYGERIKPWTYVLKKGCEVKEGEVVIEKGRRIKPQEIAILHSLGIKRVKVYRKLRVGVFSNGDEIKRGFINDINGPMIVAFVKKWGHDANYLGVVGDNYEEIRNIIMRGIDEYDILITSGGVSIGEKDYVIKVLKNEGKLLLYRVKQRPGKPLAIGIIKDKLVFGLPGKPVGAFVSCLFALRTFFLGDDPLPKVKARIAHSVKIPTKGFRYIIFVKLINDMAYPVGYVDSPVRLFPQDHPYAVSLVAQTPRCMLADGFIITERDLKEGELVEVNIY